MSTSYARLVQYLLTGAAPDDGVAVLLCRHPTGSYFPVEIKVGDRKAIPPRSVMDYYYLYSTNIHDVTHPTELMLTEDSSPEDVLLRGKLATRFFNPPVSIEFWPCDKSGDYVLCVISESAKSDDKERDLSRKRWLLNALVETAHLWKKGSSFMLTHQDMSTPALVHRVNAYLADIDPAPPYVPCLHAEMSVRPPREKEFTHGEIISNPLTYNCLLLSCVSQLRESYIDDMVMHREVTPYTQDIPLSANRLAAAINRICRDDIVTLAVVEKSQDRIFGRLNVPRETEPPQDARLAPTYPRTMWEAIRYALDFLENTHPGTTLVTVWAGRALGGSTKPEYALPVGFAIGDQWKSLGQMMEYDKLKPLMSDIQGQSKKIRLRVLWPDVNSAEENEQSTLMVNGSRQLEHLVETMERHVCAAGNSYPGPYELDFQGSDDRPLLIRQKDTPPNARCREVSADQDKNMYWFLLRLAAAKGKIVSRRELADILRCTEEDLLSIVDNRVRKPLDRDTYFHVNHHELFKNAKGGRGWRVLVSPDCIHRLPKSAKAIAPVIQDEEGDSRPLVEMLEDESTKSPMDQAIENEDQDRGRDATTQTPHWSQ